jgi:hypothetical protein
MVALPGPSTAGRGTAIARPSEVTNIAGAIKPGIMGRIGQASEDRRKDGSCGRPRSVPRPGAVADISE